MKKHTKKYLSHFGYSGYEFVPCECCGKAAVDCHHIKARGMGGSKTKDTIENLMMLCRDCHERFGDKSKFVDFLTSIHNEFILTNTSIEIPKQTHYIVQTIEKVSV